tara:strand:+ start:61 stop:177 length:117 start_codon:yes stop_codon:yes gene_type:complete
MYLQLLAAGAGAEIKVVAELEAWWNNLLLLLHQANIIL